MEAGKRFDEDPETRRWFQETYGEQIQSIMDELMTGLEGCMQNEFVMKAFEGLE